MVSNASVYRRLRAAHIPDIAIKTSLPGLGCPGIRAIVEDKKFLVVDPNGEEFDKRKNYILTGIDGPSQCAILAAMAKELCLIGETVHYRSIGVIMGWIFRDLIGKDGFGFSPIKDTIYVIPDFAEVETIVEQSPQGLTAFQELIDALMAASDYGCGVILGMDSRKAVSPNLPFPRHFQYWLDHKFEELPTK